ncbi:hypothetical protein PEBR_03221 [Penicillium brasilianum]|uniref:Uncharacterized protein n=1 Tax=Penicillium brasilianum TaxID=104259 RepID=A0A1S9RYU6_PENBI|nr:hypothetical protein PEBR_03221 [Penicillium brasilianum]
MPKTKDTTGEKPLPRPTDMLLAPSEKYDEKWLARSLRDAQRELKLNRPRWTEDFEDFAFAKKEPNAKELTRFPLYDKFEIEDGKIKLPETKCVMFTDDIVYAAIKHHTQDTRKLYRAAARYGYRIALKVDKRLKVPPTFHAGLVVLSKDYLSAPRTIIRNLQVHAGRMVDGPWGTEDKSMDVRGKQHNHYVLFFNGGSAKCVRLWTIDGWDPRCSGDQDTDVIPAGACSKMKINLDYTAIIRQPYQVNTRPCLREAPASTDFTPPVTPQKRRRPNKKAHDADPHQADRLQADAPPF